MGDLKSWKFQKLVIQILKVIQIGKCIKYKNILRLQHQSQFYHVFMFENKCLELEHIIGHINYYTIYTWINYLFVCLFDILYSVIIIYVFLKSRMLDLLKSSDINECGDWSVFFLWLTILYKYNTAPRWKYCNGTSLRPPNVLKWNTWIETQTVNSIHPPKSFFFFVRYFNYNKNNNI